MKDGGQLFFCSTLHTLHMWAVSLFFHLSSLTAPQIIYNSSYCLMGTMYYCSLWFFVQLMIMIVLARLLTHYLWVPVIVMDSTFTQMRD